MNPNPPLLDIPSDLHARVRARLEKKRRVEPSGCFIWTGILGHHGYGRVGITWDGRQRMFPVHRAAWIVYRGPIPAAAQPLVLDHLCHNRACFNPDHLEVVTTAENNARSVLSPEKQAKRPASTARTSCNHGHPWPENAAYRTSNKLGWRQRYLYCTACNKQW